MRITTTRTILFRQNINRTNAEWARFLENYRDDLIAWDQKEFGDDYHTAEDVVYEIFLEIIRNPYVTNLRPQDSFRHTLITLCKHKHRSVTKPWRKALMRKVATWMSLNRPDPKGPLYEMVVEWGKLVVANLMDKEQDAGRSYKTYSLKDLERWRIRQEADPNATNKSLAQHLARPISESVFSTSCRKLDDEVAAQVRAIMSRQGLR